MPGGEEETRVTTLELFFDLVFVFTITQLTTLLYRHATGTGLAQAILMLGVIWWMYDGYAWLTNAVTPDTGARRMLLLSAMCAFLVLALAIPRAFGGDAVAFAVAYGAVVGLHIGLYTQTSEQVTLRSVVALTPFNALSALLVLAGALTGGSAQYVLWAVAFVLEWSTPRLIDVSGFLVAPAHFVERHGLVVIVAIGESVVAIGIGVGGHLLDAGLAVTAATGLLLSAALWWTYFGGDEARAEGALRRAPASQRARLAIDAFGYWHLLILLGIVAIAAGERRATGDPFAALPFAPALTLAAGLTLFLAGDALFRRTLALGAVRARAAVALLAPLAIPAGTQGSGFVEICVLALLLAVALAAERALSLSSS